MFPLHERLLGRKTFFYLKELERLQWISPYELQKLRFNKLKSLLIHSKKNIPFYKKRFERVGFDPERMKTIEEFKTIPFLTKTEVRKNIHQMTWRECPGGLHRYNTGGSSGEPLVFYFDRRRQAYDAAARALTHRWWNVDIGEKELYFWGSPVEITKQDRIKELRDWLTNQLLLSAFELSKVKVPIFFKKMKKFKPKCIFGYPSTIALFLKMAQEQGFNTSEIGASVVFSTAEVLYEHQRKYISEALGGIPVVDGYGSREGGFISHECPYGNHHIMDPNYVIEFVKDGKEVRHGEEGELVITHLDAWGMPFIRYKTGDIAAPLKGKCGCGRTFSMMSKIKGRTTDFIVTPDGRWQHALSLIYVVRDIEGVEEFKIIQEEVDKISVLLRIHEEIYPQNGDLKIIQGLKKRMGKDVHIDIKRCNKIPRDASGKYRYVISKVGRIWQ